MDHSGREECRLFGLLRNSLRADLVSTHGFSNPMAGAILNWFDPTNAEYLERVDEWQRLLCAGAIPYAQCPVARQNSFGSYDIQHLPNHQVDAIHQVAKLVYKWHGVPRKETNMEEVKARLSQPLPVTLDKLELEELREILADLTPPDFNYVSGRFGPGATSEGFDAYAKWTRRGACPDIPPSFFRVNPRDPFTPSGFDLEGMTKIAEVPKSIKSNRIVSSEPAMRMFAQLAVHSCLYEQLHQKFRGHVSLGDAERHNKFLLRSGACSIDLSDASDHVSAELVEALLPQIWPVLAKVRSQYAQFPDGTAIRLATMAPMGSGVTFVILTLVCLAIVSLGIRYSREDLLHKRYGNVDKTPWFSVYGDDIIVPIWAYDEVVRLLRASGLVVNLAKSACSGIYRESCGREMYWSDNITPAYIRDPLSTCDASKIEDLCSKLYAKGFERTAWQCAEIAQAASRLKWSVTLQRQEVCVRTTSARQKIKCLDGYDGLNRWFCIHTSQDVDAKGKPLNQQGVGCEVWTKPAWRFKTVADYPYLTTWLVTRR